MLRLPMPFPVNISVACISPDSGINQHIIYHLEPIPKDSM